MPAMVIEAHRKRFNPSIGPKRSLIDRWLHSVAHFAMYYDFVSIHTTLQTTPAWRDRWL
jgi:hypothetical protein